MIKFITPNWPAPSQVKACTTTRHGGYSQPPYEGFNLADHVGDDAKAVAANRALLVETLNLPAEPLWLKQVHSKEVVNANADNSHCTADATVATTPGQVCVVMTADCLPVFFCDRSGTRVAVAHAGWRGLAGGVLENCLQYLDLPPKEILAWLGPAIGPQAFEVGSEVRQAFVEFLPQAAEAFKPTREDRFLADLYCLARQRLAHQGVTAIYGGDFCTYSETERFYSYRRDKVTGRMASLIWLEG
jgi:polyphenol oxidase